MGKFDEFNIKLKEMKVDSVTYEFHLDNLFFAHIDAPEIQKGNVNVVLRVKRSVVTYDLIFHCKGVVIVPCDRCLDEMEQSVVCDNKLRVKFGQEYADEGNDIVIVPETEGAINIAWFLYEFIALAIPMKHVHPAGKCNKTMTNSLKKHLVKESEEETVSGDENFEDQNKGEGEREESCVDPRWNGLKKLIDNN